MPEFTRRDAIRLAALAIASTGCIALWRHFAADESVAMDVPGNSQLPPSVWDREWKTPAGGTLSMKSLLGKPVVLNFWASWCVPCIEEIPLLDRFYGEQRAKGLQVLGIAVDKLDSVVRFQRAHPMTYPVVVAEMDGLSFAHELGNLASALPFTVVLDAQGHVVQRKLGRISTQDLEGWLAVIKSSPDSNF